MINLNPAHQIALGELAGLVPEEVARRALVEYDPVKGLFTVPFLNGRYLVKFPSGDMSAEKEAGEVSLTSRVCILHYLTHASNCALTPFTNRAIRPLVSIFGGCPEKLVEAGEKLGGQRADAGDWAVTVHIFPKVPVTFVLWEGDDEFPPSGNILFDSSAALHLETEDYALLPGLAIFQMKKAAGI